MDDVVYCRGSGEALKNLQRNGKVSEQKIWLLVLFLFEETFNIRKDFTATFVTS
jgi:hypothetical protein